MTNIQEKHLTILCRHVENVNRYCKTLGECLIENGETRTGRRLIANGYLHDHSKFQGVEWKYLRPDDKNCDKELLKIAINQHVLTNKHHPEYWLGIQNMPRIYLLEMVCDWTARSSEFGNDLREWIKDKATKKYDMTVQSKTYKEIKGIVDLMLEPLFV